MVFEALILYVLGSDLASFNAISQMHRMGFWAAETLCTSSSERATCYAETVDHYVVVTCSAFEHEICKVRVHRKEKEAKK